MELKQILRLVFLLFVRLLIVPYGIETYAEQKNTEARTLLIVPYGIETTLPEGLRLGVSCF